MEMPIQELSARIVSAKRFLNQEITAIKTQPGGCAEATTDLSIIGYHMDTIHEIERVGLRNMSELEFIKISRVLTNIESRMNLPKN